MSLVLVTPDLDKHAFEFSQGVYNPKISEQIDQTLAYLIGYDYGSSLFRFAALDNNGRQAVNTEALAKKTGITGSVTVGVVVQLIVGENDDRNQLDLYNNGLNIVYIGFTNTVAVASGFPIPAGFSFSFNNYNGPVYGISNVAGNDVRFMEVS